MMFSSCKTSNDYPLDPCVLVNDFVGEALVCFLLHVVCFSLCRLDSHIIAWLPVSRSTNLEATN